MSDIVLDAAGDIDITGGVLTLDSGSASVSQHLFIRLRTFYSEWFLDTTIGLPYFQQIMGVKNPSPILLNAIFRREILKAPGVTAVNALGFQIDSETRNLVVTASIASQDGIIDFSTELGVN